METLRFIVNYTRAYCAVTPKAKKSTLIKDLPIAVFFFVHICPHMVFSEYIMHNTRYEKFGAKENEKNIYIFFYYRFPEIPEIFNVFTKS